MQAKPFGAIDAKDYVPGAEVLAEEGNEEDQTVEIDTDEEDEEDSDSDWVDIPDSDDESGRDFKIKIFELHG